MQDILGPYYSYDWTLWQSEWATDLIFTSPGKLAGIMDSLLHHAHITGTSTAVLRYLDRPLILLCHIIRPQPVVYMLSLWRLFFVDVSLPSAGRLHRELYRGAEESVQVIWLCRDN